MRNVVASILERTPADVILTTHAAMTERQLRGEFFSDWAHPQDLADAAFVNLSDSAPVVSLGVV